MKVPDTDRNRSWLGKIRYRLGLAGYPALRMMALAETGTRGLLGAVIGSAAERARPPGPPAAAAAGPGDAGLAGPGLRRARSCAQIAATGAALLARASTRNPPVLRAPARRLLPVRLDGLPVRIIEADVDHDRRRRHPHRRTPTG